MKIENVKRALDEGQIKAHRGLTHFFQYDMRWSYYGIGVLVLVGVAVNLLFHNGWVVWPFLFGAGLMSMVHEAAERNGQGIPPLYAYAFLLGAIALWAVLALMLSVLNPVVLICGIVALGYHCAKGYIHDRQRTKLIETRRAQGRCIHCGELIEQKTAVCLNCGEEPDPVGQRMRRVASIVGGRKDVSRARAGIRPDSNATSASRREQALIARHHARRR